MASVDRRLELLEGRAAGYCACARDRVAVTISEDGQPPRSNGVPTVCERCGLPVQEVHIRLVYAEALPWRA
jgi:hypothetical protein